MYSHTYLLDGAAQALAVPPDRTRVLNSSFSIKEIIYYRLKALFGFSNFISNKQNNLKCLNWAVYGAVEHKTIN